MSYVLPKGPIGFTSGEQITSEKMNALGSNQNDMANKVSQVDDYYKNLPEVAKTGLYSDLKDAPVPVIPNDGRLTIKINGATTAIFSANQSEDAEVDILTSSGGSVDVVQTTGNSTEAVMSQAATTSAINTRASVDELDAKADKATTLAGYGITDAYTKAEVDGKLVSVFTYKGSVATVDDLPSGAKVGDVYNVQSDESEYVWDGEEWNNLGGVGDLSNYYTKSDVDSKLATKANTANTISGYGIIDAYTKEEVNTKLSGKANTATTLAGYGINDAYTKTEVDEKVKDPVYIWDFPWGAAGPSASSYHPTLEEYNELNQAIADGKQIVINTNYEIDGSTDKTLTAVGAKHYDATIGGNTTDVAFIEATEGSSVTEYKIHLFAEDGFAPNRVTVDTQTLGEAPLVINVDESKMTNSNNLADKEWNSSNGILNANVVSLDDVYNAILVGRDIVIRLYDADNSITACTPATGCLTQRKNSTDSVGAVYIDKYASPTADALVSGGYFQFDWANNLWGFVKNEQ